MGKSPMDASTFRERVDARKKKLKLEAEIKAGMEEAGTTEAPKKKRGFWGRLFKRNG